MVNLLRYFNTNTGEINLRLLLYDHYKEKIAKKLIDSLGDNVLGRSAAEIKSRAKVPMEIAESVSKLGDQVATFYYNQIKEEGYNINKKMLLQMGILHRSNAEKGVDFDVDYLNKIVFLTEELPPEAALKQYYRTIATMIYPSIVSNRAIEIINKIDLKKLFLEEEVTKVKYIGKEVTLALKRATRLLKHTPLGQALEKIL